MNSDAISTVPDARATSLADCCLLCSRKFTDVRNYELESRFDPFGSTASSRRSGESNKSRQPSEATIGCLLGFCKI